MSALSQSTMLRGDDVLVREQSEQFHLKGTLGHVTYSRGTLADFQISICDWLRAERTKSRIISYVNPHVYNLASACPKLREFLSRADLVSVDGLGIAAAVLLVNREWQTRTVMTPLFDRVLATGNLPPLRAVLIGGTEDVVCRGAAAMNRASPRIEVVATCDGYRPIEEYLHFLQKHSSVDAVFIAMGTPRSEEFALAAVDQFPGKLIWNIGGGTLHFYAGTLRRVPPVVSTLGLQWLWRMIHEPRIVPRYLVGIPIFIARILGLVFSKRHRSVLL